MPLIRLTLTHAAFDATGRQRLVQAVTEAACAAESVPDQPAARMRAMVIVHELAPGQFHSAGQPADQAVRGVFADWQVSTGVLDAARKARFAADLHRAAQAAGPEDGRMVVTSCVVDEVAEGQWAQMGGIARLPQVAAVARFEHLASVAVQAAA